LKIPDRVFIVAKCRSITLRQSVNVSLQQFSVSLPQFCVTDCMSM